MKKNLMMFLLSLCSLSAPFVTAQELREEFRWQGRLASAQAVEVQSIRGNIRVESTTGDQVEIVAVKHGRDNPGQVKIEMLKHDGGITFCAVYPSANANQSYQCLPNSTGALQRVNTDIDQRDQASIRLSQGGGGEIQLVDVDVDFLVRLPRGVRFIGLTVLGDVASQHTTGDVTAQSVHGDVRIILSAQVSASVQAEAELGYVVSDYPLSVKPRGQFGQITRDKIGAGDRKLALKAVTGNVYLQRTQ